MDGTGIQAIEKVVREAADITKRIVTVGDVEYTAGIALLPIRPPMVETLKVHTLAGLVAFLGTYTQDTPLVHVVDEGLVRVLSPVNLPHRLREIPCEAAYAPLFGGTKGASFEFGSYHAIEAFVVGLQTLFVPTPERDAVLSLVGNITDQAELTVLDDGVSQEVSQRAGVVLQATKKVPSPVTLKPFRTFRELEQPASPFVLRVRRDPSRAPVVALFEADGGAWKLEAIKAIAEFLRGNLVTATILA